VNDRGPHPAEHSAVSHGRAAFGFVFVTVLLDMIALGIIIPVLPGLIVGFMGGDTARGAEMFGLFGTAWALMQFLFSPMLGALADRFGRRPVILLSNLGLGLDYILMALAPSLAWLFVGRVISGVTSASITAGFAYVADVTPPEKRAARFGLLGVAFGAGFVLGPALGGLAGGVDPRLPFWIAAILSLLNTLYGLFILPESLPPALRMPFAWRKANPLGSLALLGRHRELAGLATVSFLSMLAHAVLPAVGVLYMGYRYGWDERTMGLVLALVGICSIAVQGGLIGPVVQRFGERHAMLAGLAFGGAGMSLYGLAPNGTLFLVAIPVMSLWGFASAAGLALMSRRLGPDEQRALQGANASLMGIANLIGPGLFTVVFAQAIGGGWQVPGAPFLLAAVLLFAAMGIGWRATIPRAES
jgi:DHA1 family tetracycline resistance protein-like MFS transporter